MRMGQPGKRTEGSGGLKRNMVNHWILMIQIGLNSLVGYLFLKVLAVKFGIMPEKDGFDIAYSVPFIILSVSGFMFLHGIITSQFAKMLANSPSKIEPVFATTLNSMLLLGAFCVAVFIAFSRQIIDILAPGLSPLVQEQTRQLMILMIPLVFPLGIGTFFSAILVAYGVPISAELCQLVSRLGVVVEAWLLGRDFNLVEIAWSLLLYSIVGLLLEWMVLGRVTGLKYRFYVGWKDPDVMDIYKQGLGFLVVAFLAQLSMSYMRRLATIQGVGIVAGLTYALSLMAPLSLFLGKPLGLIVGPQYIRFFEKGEIRAAGRILIFSVIAATAIGVGFTFAVSYAATPLIRWLYGGGAFDGASVDITAALLKPIMWALAPAVILWIVFLPALNDEKVHAAAVIYCIGYVMHIILSFILVQFWGKDGLVWAYVLSITLQATLAVGLVINRHVKLGKGSR